MKIKHKILFIILGFLITFLLLLSTEVKASTNKLIVDGYDMSDIYNYFNPEDSFFIAKFGNTYRMAVPSNSSYKSYCAIQSYSNSIAYFNSSWKCLEGNNYNFYNFNTSTLKFSYSWTGAYDHFKIANCTVAYTSKGIYNSDHKTFYLEPSAVMPSLEWTYDRRASTIIMNSQYFTLEDISKYNLYYTTNSLQVENYKNLPYANIGSLQDSSTGDTSYFWFLTFENYFISSETYYFILEDINSGEISTSSMTINFNSLNEYFDEQLNQDLTDSGFTTGTSFTNGVPTLQMKYTRYMNADSTYYYQISSQYFSQYEVTDQYVAYYTNDTSILEDYSSWSHLNIATFKDTKTGQINYYYFFNMPSDSENTTYYFVLYNKITGQYGSVSSLTLDFNKMWEYSEQLKNDNNVVNSRFDKLIEYIKERFGFILYPFDLIGEIFNRFYNINWEEPIIKIPPLNVPVFRSRIN